MKTVYESGYSSRKAGVIDIDICWVIEYLKFSSGIEKQYSMEQTIENMVNSYKRYVDNLNVTEKEFYGIN